MSRVTVPALSVAFSVGNFAQIVRLGGAFILDIEQRQTSSNNCNINFFRFYFSVANRWVYFDCNLLDDSGFS